MSTDRPPSYRPVNPVLGVQPKIGPLPANQLLPWMIISGTLWMLASMIALPTIWTVLLIFWGDITWWLLTGKQPWRFLSKFIGVPNFTRGRVRYRSIHAAPGQPKLQSAARRRRSQNHRDRSR